VHHFPSGPVGEFAIDSFSTNGGANPHNGGGPQDRQEWIRANFTQIFGTSIENLQAQGINPRQYAREHRSEIRQFAQQQRRQGIAVPAGRPSGNFGPQGTGGSNGGGPNGGGPDGGGQVGRRYGYGGGRLGMGMRGGSAWIGILLVLFALRFLLVDSFAGTHVAVFWVLGIGGIMLVARVFLFSWLRRRRYSRRSNGRSSGQSGF
jgi:hypothetical protein